MKLGTLVFFLLLFAQKGYSQERNIERDSLLGWIAAQQVVEDDFYDAGIFKSTRIYGKNQYEDNTLFYSSLIALTLQSLSDKFSLENKLIVDSISAQVVKNVARYRSRRGRPAYNYWQTNPDIPHPDGPEKYQTDKYKLPDDFDDTSMIGLLVDEGMAQEIREEIVNYTGARKKRVKTTFKRFKKSEAYGVWFADKWKQEFDICVLSNTLSFVFKNNFKLNKYDSASIDLIKESIVNDLHKKHPFVLSPYYNRTPVILYHISRLISNDRNGHFVSIKSKIIDDIQAQLEVVQLEMYKVILATSLLRLGEPLTIAIDEEKLRQEKPMFNWFTANFMLAVGSGVTTRKIINDSRLIPTFYWRCDPYFWTLYLEYLVWSAKT